MVGTLGAYPSFHRGIGFGIGYLFYEMDSYGTSPESGPHLVERTSVVNKNPRPRPQGPVLPRPTTPSVTSFRQSRVACKTPSIHYLICGRIRSCSVWRMNRDFIRRLCRFPASKFQWEENLENKKLYTKPTNCRHRLFLIFHLPPRLQMPPSETKKLPAPQSQSAVQHSRSSSGSCNAKEKRVISVETKRIEESSGCVISSLDYKLPSPWNGDVKPAYSPFRDLGPSDDAVRRLRNKAASTFISLWWKSNPNKQKPKPNSSSPVSSFDGGELLMDREALWVEVNENSGTNNHIHSLK